MVTKKTPLPGYGLVILDESLMEHVEYPGDDRFDTPQSGLLLTLLEEDKTQKVKEYSGVVFGDLLDKKVFWRRYADQDATFDDTELGKKIAFIKLEAIVGYE